MESFTRSNSESVHLNNLPSELLQNIFSYLDYKDLVCCSYLSRRLHDISNHNAHWKRQFIKYWLETKCPSSRSWKDHFRCFYLDMGRYIHCYAVMKSTWDKIIKFMSENCPVIYKSINNGVTEKELDEVEMKLNIRLPDDLRCSFRIHNGQRLTSPGLMGSMSIHNRYHSESLLDLETAIAGFQNKEGMGTCIPLTLCLHSGLAQFLVLTDDDGYTPNTIFYPSKSLPLEYGSNDAFITGESFIQWFSVYANQLANEEFPVLHEQPFRFLHEPGCKQTTGCITVAVSTCFIPELSIVNPPHFFHTYRITMTMSPDAPSSMSCQLETRHWTIIDENGVEKRADGPGVVGEYPLMYPGSVFSWVSCTNFSTQSGTMKGYFTMRNLATGDLIDVQCPEFHMKCLPYLTYEKRQTLMKAKN